MDDVDGPDHTILPETKQTRNPHCPIIRILCSLASRKHGPNWNKKIESIEVHLFKI